MSSVLITGGAKRVGAYLALYFARAGYDIALHYNRSGKEARILQKEIEGIGQHCKLFQLDLKNAAKIPALMKNVQKTMPDCVALINNASIFERAPLMQTDEKLFDRQLGVNLKAPFFLTQAFAKTFKKGCVVNILDTDISKNQHSHFAYLLAKKALAEFVPMAAAELGPKIRVNGVCPGSILPSDQNDKNYEKKTAALVPLKKNPGPEEVAEAALWLSEQDYITGQIIFMDGGKHVL